METIIITIFVLGYLAITLEHSLKVDKLIPALAMMALMWAIISLSHLPVFDVNTELKQLEPTHIDEILLHHLVKTAEIIIFLLGAMTIVEIIDYFNGFFTIKNFIKTRSKKGLLWIFSILAFILSAIIDNLTATIVLITILQKVVVKRETRLWFAGLIIVAANAGGACKLFVLLAHGKDMHVPSSLFNLPRLLPSQSTILPWLIYNRPQ